MAKIEDVVVSDRPWRWKSCPPGVVGGVSTAPFVIASVLASGVAFKYVTSTGLSPAYVSTVAAIAAHAEPEPLPETPKCAPTCTPANPCWTEKACRAFNEPTALAMLDVNKAYAASRWRAVRDEPIELRCGRDLACGLFRTP